MHYLGKKWHDVFHGMEANNINYTTEITMPTGNVTPDGDLRVVRVKKVEGTLKFILLHDRFNK